MGWRTLRAVPAGKVSHRAAGRKAAAMPGRGAAMVSIVICAGQASTTVGRRLITRFWKLRAGTQTGSSVAVRVSIWRSVGRSGHTVHDAIDRQDRFPGRLKLERGSSLNCGWSEAAPDDAVDA